MLSEQISCRGAIQILLFWVLGLSTAGALIRIPIPALDTRTLLYWGLGLLAIPLLDRELRFPYVGHWITWAGAAGLLLLLASRTQRFLGSSAFAHYRNRALGIAGLFYSLLHFVGLLAVRQIRRQRTFSA